MADFIKPKERFKKRRHKNLLTDLKVWYRIHILHQLPIIANSPSSPSYKIKRRSVKKTKSCLYVMKDGVKYTVFWHSESAIASQDINNLQPKIKIEETILIGDMSFTVKEIALAGFAKNDRLMEIFIPVSVKTISTAAFKDCKNLVNVSLPNRSHIKFGEGVFAGCDWNKLNIVHRDGK